MKKLPISVCMISGSEAGRIGKALASVSDWASEIIVVLNEEVCDGTDQIAAKYGAQVFRESWKGHIAQKNSAVDKATQPWILGLDADEEVSPELRDEISRTLADSNKAQRYSVFSFPRLTFYSGRWIRHGEWYPDRKIRLFRNGMARWGGIDPHDKLQVDGRIGKLQGNLLHYTADDMDQQIAKTVRYAEDFARHCADRGRTIRWFDLVMRPFWRFFRAYVLRRGFLDGWQGYSIAWMAAFYTYLRYAKAREACHKPDILK